MFLQSESRLTISDIADHWSRELADAWSCEEIEQHLVAAFWRKELQAHFPLIADPRPFLLDQVAKAIHAGLVVIGPGETAPPDQIEIDHGTIAFDLRIRVHWPSENPKLSYLQMAKAALAGIDGSVLSFILVLQVTRRHFEEYCRQQGFRLPRFWFPSNQAQRAAANEASAKRAFQALVAQNDKPGPKDVLRKRFTSEYEIPGPYFDRLWACLAPADWKQAGAPKRKGLIGRAKIALPV